MGDQTTMQKLAGMAAGAGLVAFVATSAYATHGGTGPGAPNGSHYTRAVAPDEVST